MLISIDLAQQKLFVAVMQKNVLIQQFAVPLPSLEKGNILNVEEAAAALAPALRDNHVHGRSCVFVLPSSAVLTKEMQVPMLSRAELLQLVRTNFRAVTEAGDDYVADYMPMEGGDKPVVMGILVRRHLLTQCRLLAKQLKLHCKRVELHMSALRKYRKQQGTQDATEIVVCVNEHTAEINLFDGRRTFIRTADLQEKNPQDNLLKNWAMSYNDTLVESKTDDRVRLLTEQLHNIQQFQLSRNGQRPVERVCFFGTADLQLCRDVETGMAVSVEPLDSRESMLPYLHALGAGLSSQNELNLLEPMRRRTPEEAKIQRANAVFLLVVVVLGTVGVALGAFFQQRNNVMSSQIDQYQDFLTAETTVQVLNRARTAEALLAAQKEYNETLGAFQVFLETQFRLTSGRVSRIYTQAKFSGVTIQIFDYQGGSLRLSCMAPSATVAAEFSKTLQQTKLADEVTFSGYTMETNQQGNYRFQLSAKIQQEMG